MTAKSMVPKSPWTARGAPAPWRRPQPPVPTMYSGPLITLWRTATPPSALARLGQARFCVFMAESKVHRGSPGSRGEYSFSDLHRGAAHDGCFGAVQRFRVWDPARPPAGGGGVYYGRSAPVDSGDIVPTREDKFRVRWPESSRPTLRS